MSAAVIKDSSAILDPDRLLAQHQAALTLLQARLQKPQLKEFAWLDLACGRGQMIVHLETNLSRIARGKIDFHLFDAKASYISDTKKKALTLGFRNVFPVTAPLGKFPEHFKAEELFDFITLTNTVHELAPRLIASTLVDCVLRLRPNGSLFIYDFETFPEALHELGAISWTGPEIQEIISVLLTAFKIADHQPEVGQWKHKTCFGWNLNLQRENLACAHGDLLKGRDAAIQELHKKIIEILRRKLEQTKQMLSSFTEEGIGSPEEEIEKVEALYNFWALNRALEVES